MINKFRNQDTDPNGTIYFLHQSGKTTVSLKDNNRKMKVCIIENVEKLINRKIILFHRVRWMRSTVIGVRAARSEKLEILFDETIKGFQLVKEYAYQVIKKLYDERIEERKKEKK